MDPKLGEGLWKASDNLIEVLSAGEIMNVKRVEKAACAVSPRTAENGGLSLEIFVADLDKKVDSSCSARVTLSRVFCQNWRRERF